MGHSVRVPCHVAGTPYISGQRNTDRPECAAATLNCDQHTHCNLNCDTCSKVTTVQWSIAEQFSSIVNF